MDYEQVLKFVIENGSKRKDRTGTGTISKFGCQIRYDVSEFFPLITSKRIFFKGVAEELFWFLRGEHNVHSLQENNVHIWDDWADENGELGPVYGKQWRDWNGIDQIENILQEIKQNPYSRRLIVSAWNVSDLDYMALPPCHTLWQCYVSGNELSIQVYQRSADMFLGVPFNIASYSLLLYMIAQQTDLKPKELIWTGGDCHIYINHIEQVKEQLSRPPLPLPKLELTKAEDIFSYCCDDLKLIGYDPHPTIKAPIAI